MELHQLMVMPWSIHGPRKVIEEGSTHWEIKIQELPDFFVAATSRDEVLREYHGALQAYLQSYTDRQQVPPLPKEQNVWWVFSPAKVEQPTPSVKLEREPQPVSAAGQRKSTFFEVPGRAEIAATT
jgi:predicted RNase H-like HicB family nuclease